MNEEPFVGCPDHDPLPEFKPDNPHLIYLMPNPPYDHGSKPKLSFYELRIANSRWWLVLPLNSLMLVTVFPVILAFGVIELTLEYLHRAIQSLPFNTNREWRWKERIDDWVWAGAKPRGKKRAKQ